MPDAGAVPRIASLDMLRGVAVLGMLLVNVQSFSSVAAARTHPDVLGDLAPVEWGIWLATYVLADGKFMAVFAMLFGASIALRVDRSGPAAGSTARIHYRRMAILFVVGLIHAYVLWHGDILAPLALCGALAFLYRGLAPARLLTVGVVLFAIGGLVSAGLAGWWLTRPSGLSAAVEYWAPSADAVAWEVDRYRGGWLEQMQHRAPHAFRTQTASLGARELWRLTGLMLVGMGLFKLGVLRGERPARFYGIMAGIGFAAGLPPILYAAGRIAAGGSDVSARIVVDQVNYWSSAPVALGWIGIVMGFCRLTRPLGPLAAVGRMALTSYLVQTAICTTIFYGHGLGLFGRVDRLAQLALVGGIWALQLAASTWWVKVFAFGPMEWAWRCLALARWLPMRAR